MANNNLTSFTDIFKGLIGELNILIPKSNPLIVDNNVNENNINIASEINGYFTSMLDITKEMLGNMNEMETGFSKTAELILKIFASILNSGSGGGIGGLFGGILGVIGGAIAGPLGAAAGGGLGSLFGGISAPPGINNLSFEQPAPRIINNIVIKNPVTFQKAFDVEVRKRELRGGIDL